MINKRIDKLLDLIINFDDDLFDIGNLYVFKSLKDRKSTNPNITLKYHCMNVSMSKNTVIQNLKIVFSYLKESVFLKDSIFSKYDINNPKKIFDYMIMKNFDFSNDNIKVGNISSDIDVNHYKIRYLLNEIKSSSNNFLKGYKDFDTMRYTCTRAHISCNNRTHNIYIINKCKPLIKAKNSYYIYDPTDDTNIDNKFKLVEKKLFKMPFHPSMIIIDDLCIFVDDKIESIFGFEDFNNKICKEKIKDIKKDLILDEDSCKHLDTIIKQKQIYNLFADFSCDTLTSIISEEENLDINFLKNSLKIDITWNSSENKNNLILDSKDKAINFLKFICGHIKREPTSDTPVSVTKSQQIKIN